MTRTILGKAVLLLCYTINSGRKKRIGCSQLPFLLVDVSTSFLVDISTSFGENPYANLSLLRNRKFDLISQSGWITLHARDYQL